MNEELIPIYLLILSKEKHAGNNGVALNENRTPLILCFPSLCHEFKTAFIYCLYAL